LTLGLATHLCREQQEREEREAARREGRPLPDGSFHAAPSFEELGMNPGSFDNGDPMTSNL
jgi:hypothetical protein